LYLPPELSNARVLITVKTYPLPSNTYGELVCTAGLLDGNKWIRIYPVPYRFLKDDQRYPRYSWVELDLVRNDKDFRPESYRPRNNIEEDIRVIGKLGTADSWAARKEYVLKEVFTSMNDLLALAKGAEKKSLATLKPIEITDFVVEDDEREWKKEWIAKLKQMSLFDLDAQGAGKERKVIRKLPYKFSYRLLTEGDDQPRKMMIEDWEIGQLYWNCLLRADGDEAVAVSQVRQKYFDEFQSQRDIHLFLGTTMQYHAKAAPNPFVIIGVFYPPKTSQLSLF
jgi:hypothetical protein